MTQQVDLMFNVLTPTVYQDFATNDFVGDVMDEEPTESTTRLYFQNLNGLNWDQQGGKWPYICEVMESIQVDIACFAELNTDTNRYEVRRKMEQISQQQHGQNRLVMASSKNKTSTVYKPGGTAILACNAITNHIKSHTRDRMGRWVSMCISVSTSNKLRIIAAYQVCSTTSTGTNTAAAQQLAQIIEEQAKAGSTHRTSPREAFIQDLQTFILQAQQDGEDIVLTGDFNDDITSQNSGMDQLATTCGLVDLFSIRTGSATHPPTYQRGPRRLDYVLISPSLLPKVQAAGYDPFGYRIPTDHRGFFIDFTSDSLLSHELTPLTPATKRNFKSTTPGTVAKYVSAKFKYLEDHQFFNRLKTLSALTSPDPVLAESLDRDFQRASHHAAKICARRQQPPWSPQLAEAWAELHFYKLARSQHSTNTDASLATEKLRSKWSNLPTTIPTAIVEIEQGYATALRKLQAARQEAKELRENTWNVEQHYTPP